MQYFRLNPHLIQQLACEFIEVINAVTMGITDWFWGTSSETKDPVNDLDPSLRSFLEKESPKAHTSVPKEKPSWLSQAERQSGLPPSDPSPSPPQPTAAEDDDDKPKVPPESLFQDGRYAHIWKNYKPLAQIEEAGKTTSDKLHEIHDVHAARRTSTAQAARENCVEYEAAYTDCLSSTTWNSKMFMCTTEQRALSRCVDMQVRFLKALGYMGAVGDREAEERAQMHADRLFQRMIEQEKAREEARKEGREPPSFEPILSPASVSAAMGAAPARQLRQGGSEAKAEDAFDPSDIPAKYHAAFYEETKDKSPEEAQIWKESLKQEIKHRTEYAIKYKAAMELEKEQRQKRFDRGAPTIGDRMKRWWGWDNRVWVVEGVDEEPTEVLKKKREEAAKARREVQTERGREG